ncbi:tetratricopeptide repeat protein [Aurantiacibacter sp. MUD61]|uniref:tetratricopeptide repeat protein n=1 Tax=Aurantiacibacter sp. MUD61 TaxID=3009083 RepID=UPI0022F0EB89|nr:hypothetical protein [Aurantiacibacter sp. MUD61]
MAVGYEMMGRSDVARRYFLAAIEADPADPRFHRNLARLDGTATGTAFAEVEQQPEPALAGDAEALEVTVADLAVTQSVDSAEPLPTRLQRVSSREVMIASRDEWGPRLVAGQAERPAVFHIDQRGRTNPVVNAERERNYPVQFAVAAIAEQSDAADRPAEDESQFQTSEGRVFVRVSGELQRRTVSTYPISFNLGRN